MVECVPVPGVESTAPASSLRSPGCEPRKSGTTEAERQFLARHALIAPQWQLMGVAFAGALLLAGLASVSLPSRAAAMLALVAMAVAAAAPKLAGLERHYPLGDWHRYAVLGASVGLPMLAMGLSVALWTQTAERLDWRTTAALLAALSALSALVLNGRPISIVVASLSLWAGAAPVGGNVFSLAMLAAGAAAAVWLAIRQSRLIANEEEVRFDLARAQLRAEDILRDYELTGQGWFWETDRRGHITYVSPPIGILIGRAPDELVGRPFGELFDLDMHDQESERTLTFHLSARSAFQELTVRAAIANEGEERWWSVNGRPVHDHFGNFLGFRGSGSDLTERRRSQRHASRLAHFDSLTGLANRLHMTETLDKIVAAPRAEQRACTVFLLDLDRFKQVNDTLGHPAGDALLKHVAQRLERVVDKSGRVGRLGGDEFQVVLPGRQPREDLAQLARRIIETLSQPYSIDGHRVMIGASLGIARSPDDGETTEALIRNADLALYAAKDGGRGRCHFYAADLHSQAEMRRQLEQDLRDAIAGGELELHYQPVVQTTTERITGFEALLRWTHPRLGPLSPGKFVPIAEDAGLIAPLGEWALRTACLELAGWPETVRVAVNVSALQFANPALPAIVTSALAAAQVAPDRLELEITESVFLGDDSATEAMFAALKRVGVRLALDDFGTGYSSLGYLKKAPFDKIKIDQSFVRGATINGSRNGAIIGSIVSLAEALGMETTAEGVETLDELDLVRTLGCSHVQGYIYDKPLNPQAAAARIAVGLSAIAAGPRSARAARHTMLRRVELRHDGHSFDGKIRNISHTGALIESTTPMPPGTPVTIRLPQGRIIEAITRWTRIDRMGVEFAKPLPLDENGTLLLGPLPRSKGDVAAA